MVEWMLVRHAKSDWNDSSLSDKQRPLNIRGQKAAVLLGEKLQARDMVPERVLCSTAVRAYQTLQGLMQVFSQYSETKLPEVLYFEELYLALPQTIEDIVSAHHGEKGRVMCIGHNPGMEHLASHLAGEYLEMKTAHLIVFRKNGGFSNASQSKNGWDLAGNLRGEDA